MKRQVAIAMGLAVLSTGALASKARLEALGEDTYGSHFIDDSRNVILNPATLNHHKDFVTLEWGSTTAQPDTADTPRAEGGFFKATGNMVYGLYLGDESDTANGIRAAAMPTKAVSESNNTSFFVAGDAGVQWGVAYTYHKFENEQSADDPSSAAQRINVGVISGDMEGFLKVGLENKAESGTEEFEGKGSYQLGFTYGMGDVDYMLEYRGITAENAGGDEFKAQYTYLGVAKTYKLNDKATVWTSAWYRMENTECDMGATCANTGKGQGEQKDAFLPVSIAMEYVAKDWLTLRGSIGQNIIGTTEDDNGDSKTIEDTTLVRAGASLTFGDLVIDGVIGNDADGNGDPAASGDGDSTADGNGVLRADQLMSRVSMTYKF